jgi:uncharacterized membrane protein
MLIGNEIAGMVTKFYTTGSGEAIQYNWQAIWTVPAVMAIVITVGFALLFTESKKVKEAVKEAREEAAAG